MENEVGRWRCISEDESIVSVVEYRHVPQAVPGVAVRQYPGARRLALTTGEQVRYIDAATFEVVETGELLRRIA